MKISNWRRSLAKKLGMAAVAGTMAIGTSSASYADPVTIGDQGFEDHVIDDASGYAYGAALQAGDPDGFNNPSSSGGGVSPWQALGTNGNGIGGNNASFMITSAYNNGTQIGNQAIEVQGLIAQNLAAVFQIGMDYEFTVYADPAAGGGASTSDVILGLYDAGAVTFLPASDPTLITAAPSLVQSGNLTPVGGGGDLSFTFSAASLAGLAGQNIGIAIWNSDTSDFAQGAAIDNVRLTAIPEPGALSLLGVAGLGMFARRRRK